MNRPYTIAVDFDDTCVFGRYPEIGEEIPYATQVLRRLSVRGIAIILLTMREGEELQSAVDWFKERNIPLLGINVNPDPTWILSRKVFADLYVDDRNVGTPKISDHIDWLEVEKKICNEWRQSKGVGLTPASEVNQCGAQ